MQRKMRDEMICIDCAWNSDSNGTAADRLDQRAGSVMTGNSDRYHCGYAHEKLHYANCPVNCETSP